MIPGSTGGSEDDGCGFGPDKGSGAPVVLGDVAFDCRRQGDDAGEGSEPQSTARERGKEAFDGVEAGGGGRGELEGAARVAGTV